MNYERYFSYNKERWDIMAVLKSMRKISRYEFEKNYTEFVHQITPQLKQISKRRKEFIYDPLSLAITEAFNSILKVHTYMFSKQTNTKEAEIRLIQNAIIDVMYIQKPLLIYWNVFKVEFDKQSRFADMLNRELSLLFGLLAKYTNKEKNDLEQEIDKKIDMSMNKNRKRKYPKASKNIHKSPYKFYVLDWAKINSMDVLKTACILHRNIHGKLVRGVHELGYTEAPILVRIIDDMFVNVMRANVIYPTNSKEYEKRTRCLDFALRDLSALQSPLLCYCNLMDYTEETMIELADLIEKESKLINGVKQSDKKRFAHLNQEDAKESASSQNSNNKKETK